jgi:hypothetical protein
LALGTTQDGMPVFVSLTRMHLSLCLRYERTNQSPPNIPPGTMVDGVQWWKVRKNV